jgi:cell division protein FtsB
MHARPLLRFLGRMGASALALLVLTLVGIQFGRVIGQDVGMSAELSSVRTQITALQKRRIRQQAEIRRLHDPEGSVPEIHDRLRMVRSNEEIIFVSPAPSSRP